MEEPLRRFPGRSDPFPSFLALAFLKPDSRKTAFQGSDHSAAGHTEGVQADVLPTRLEPTPTWSQVTVADRLVQLLA